MTPEEYSKWLHDRLDDIQGKEYIQEWFMPEDLEEFVRKRSLHKTDWDDPMDWVNGVTIGLAFSLREYFPDNAAEAKFRIQIALFLTDLIRRIEWNED